jgi:hypothetical protein
MTPRALGREPSLLPQADLAAAFGPPDRAAALTGLLRPSPASEPSDSVASISDLVEESGHAAEPVRQQPDMESPQHSRSRDKPIVVIVYLPVSLRDRLRTAAGARGATYTTVVLEALDATHDKLDELLGGHRPNLRPGSLFSSEVGRSRPRSAEPHVQVSLRLTRSNLQVVDRLVSEHDAPNRSALVASAVAAYLGKG